MSLRAAAACRCVDLAPSGEAALTLAATKHPDLVILDLGLPGIDGIEVIRGLRGWSTMPIIVLSVREAERDKVAALDAGADDYVTKPLAWTNSSPGCARPTARRSR